MKQIPTKVIASLVETAAGRSQAWFDALKPVDQKKYLKENPNSKFGKKVEAPTITRKVAPSKSPSNHRDSSLQKHKSEVTNTRQANARIKALQEEEEKLLRLRPRTDDGKAQKEAALKKIKRLQSGLEKHKESLKSAPAVKPAATKGAAIPTEPSAVKVLNSLAKNFGVTKFRSWGDSNPFSDIQQLGGKIDLGKVSDLTKTLESQGWKRQDSYGNWDAYKSLAGALIKIGKDGQISVLGKKKAKMSSAPFYD